MPTVAEIVNEWFQGEPTPERQQNMRRTTLIADLEALFAAKAQRAFTAGFQDGQADTRREVVDMRKTFDEQERS